MWKSRHDCYPRLSLITLLKMKSTVQRPSNYALNKQQQIISLVSICVVLLSPFALPAEAQDCTASTGRPYALLPLLRADDDSYYANFSVGSPPQNFLLQIDTCSGDMWIPGVSALRSGWFVNHSYFQPNKSSTYIDLNVR